MSLDVLELGDDAAKALGARVERMRLVLLGIAVVLVALATAVAGPLTDQPSDHGAGAAWAAAPASRSSMEASIGFRGRPRRSSC